VAGACECGNEHSGSIKVGNFLTSLGTSWFFRKEIAETCRNGSISMDKCSLLVG
jgi:hypothetical protein